MINDSANLAFSGDPDVASKSPSDASVNFIRQFARVYSSHKGVKFSSCILN